MSGFRRLTFLTVTQRFMQSPLRPTDTSNCGRTTFFNLPLYGNYGIVFLNRFSGVKFFFKNVFFIPINDQAFCGFTVKVVTGTLLLCSMKISCLISTSIRTDRFEHTIETLKLRNIKKRGENTGIRTKVKTKNANYTKEIFKILIFFNEL